jgi:peptidoglycan/LPS O-acetylase OafA/YrhL
MPASAPEWPPRLHLLDLSRGLAALIVVVWHWQHFAYVGDRPPASFDFSSQPLYGVLRLGYELGYWAVDYFFCLSGFIFFWLYREALATRAVSLGQFWGQRFARLYPLHLATLLLVTGLQAAYLLSIDQAFVYPLNDTYHFVLNLGLAQLWGFEYHWSFNGPAASISVEILLYAVFCLLALTRLTRPALCAGVAVVCGWLWLGAEWHHGLFRGLASFLMGGITWLGVRTLAAQKPTWIPLVHGGAFVGWALVLISIYARPLTTFADWAPLLASGLTIFGLFPLTVGALALREWQHPSSRPALAWLGDSSYAIYLLHFPLQLAIAVLVQQGLVAADFYRHPVSLAVFFPVLLSLAWATFRWFERPLQTYLRRRLGGS